MVRPFSRKSLMRLASLAAFGAVALAAGGAAATSLTSSARISPAMSHVDSLGGGFGAHTDRIFGPGGDSSGTFAECYRRAYQRLAKADSNGGSETISAKARRNCGT